jgi:hypothetical protein
MYMAARMLTHTGIGERHYRRTMTVLAHQVPELRVGRGPGVAGQGAGLQVHAHAGGAVARRHLRDPCRLRSRRGDRLVPVPMGSGQQTGRRASPARSMLLPTFQTFVGVLDFCQSHRWTEWRPRVARPVAGSTDSMHVERCVCRTDRSDERLERSSRLGQRGPAGARCLVVLRRGTHAGGRRSAHGL